MPPAMLRLAVILGLLSMLGPFSIDMYLPALPLIAEDLQSSEAAVQATIVSYFFAYGAAQMIFGPWSDFAGRRTPMLAGGAIFVIGAVGSAMSSTLESLLVWRAVQGFGGSALMLIPRAVVRDNYTGVPATRLMAMILLVISISPMIAPLVGTIIISFTDWRAVFWILSIIAVLSLTIMYFALEETLAKEDRVPINLRKIADNCAVLLKDRYYMGLVAIGAVGMGSFFIYLSSSPFVFTSQFGLTPGQFSVAFAVNAIGFFSASQLAGPLASRIGLPRTVLFGSVLFAVTTLLLALLTFTSAPGLILVIFLLFLGNAGLGFVIPITMVMALDPYGKMAGLASSLAGTIQLVFGGMLIAFTGLFFDGSLTPMVTMIAVCGVTGMALSWLTLKQPAQSD